MVDINWLVTLGNINIKRTNNNNNNNNINNNNNNNNISETLSLHMGNKFLQDNKKNKANSKELIPLSENHITCDK